MGVCAGTVGLALLISLPWVVETVAKPRIATWGFGIGLIALAAFFLVVSWRLLMNRPRTDGGLLPARFLAAYGLAWGVVALCVLVFGPDRMPDPLPAGGLAVDASRLHTLVVAPSEGARRRLRLFSTPIKGIREPRARGSVEELKWHPRDGFDQVPRRSC